MNRGVPVTLDPKNDFDTTTMMTQPSVDLQGGSNQRSDALGNVFLSHVALGD